MSFPHVDEVRERVASMDHDEEWSDVKSFISSLLATTRSYPIFKRIENPVMCRKIRWNMWRLHEEAGAAGWKYLALDGQWLSAW